MASGSSGAPPVIAPASQEIHPGRNAPERAAARKEEPQEQQAAAPAQEATPEAPKEEEKQPSVSDDDWDILERIFSRKR